MSFALSPRPLGLSDNSFGQNRLTMRTDAMADTTHVENFGRIDARWKQTNEFFQQNITGGGLDKAVDANVSAGFLPSLGPGISPAYVDIESSLLRTPTPDQRQALGPPDQLRQMNPRPMIGVPYLGRGSVDSDAEFLIMRGVREPVVTTKTTRPDRSSDYYAYLDNTRNIQAAYASYPQQGVEPHWGLAQRHTFQAMETQYEDHTQGVSPFGINTRMRKYQASTQN